LAYTHVSYTGNGSNQNFSVTFPYLDMADVKVYLGGVESSAFTWLNSTTIRMNAAPAVGVVVLLKRFTAHSARKVDFTNDSILTGGNLDLDSDQLFYIGQELIEKTMQVDSDDTWDALSRVLKNVATPTVATDAATKGYVDDRFTSEVLREVAGVFTAESKRIGDVANPVNAQDAVTKYYLDDRLTANEMPLEGGGFNASSHKVINVTDPTANQDAATKKYVDDQKTAAQSYSDTALGTHVATLADYTRTLGVADMKIKAGFWVDVRAYGAVGDGSTDDTAAFSNAIATGKNVFVPPSASYYKITATLTVGTIGQVIFGGGLKSHVKMLTANTNLFHVTADYVEIRSMKLEGSGSGSTTALPGTYGAAVVLYEADYCKVKDNVILNCGTLGIAGAGIWLSGAKYCEVSSNNISNCNHGINTDAWATSSVSLVNKIKGNTLQNCYAGYTLDLQGGQITNNRGDIFEGNHITCKIRSKLDTQSGFNWTLNPELTGQSIRS